MSFLHNKFFLKKIVINFVFIFIEGHFQQKPKKYIHIILREKKPKKIKIKEEDMTVPIKNKALWARMICFSNEQNYVWHTTIIINIKNKQSMICQLVY